MTVGPDQLLALALSRPADAVTTARQILAGEPSPGQAAVAHQAIGLVLREFGDIRESIAELRTALRLATRAGVFERQAEVQATLGVALVKAGRTRHGLAMLEGVISDSRTTGVLAGRVLIRRTHILSVLGRNLEALRDARQAVNVLSRAGDVTWEARALSHRADVYLAMGLIQRAENDYVRSEELFEKAGQQLEYADLRRARGAAAFARGDLPAALRFLDDATDRVDELGVLEPELFVNKCSVLLAAGLYRDAVAESDAALNLIQRQGGSATARAELLYVAAQAALAAGELDVAAHRAADAQRLFRQQRRPGWAGRAELVMLQCRYGTGERTRALLSASARLARRMDETDPSRAGDAHLMAGRTALACGRMRPAESQLRAAARTRRRELHSRAVSWLARATLHQAQSQPAAMLAACDRGLELIDTYLRSLGATELRVEATSQGADLAAMALRHAAGRRNARQMLIWSERWRANALAVPPVHPPSDDVLAAELAALRNLVRRIGADSAIRSATSRLDGERRRLEAAVRKRILHTPGVSTDRPERFRVRALLDRLGEQQLIELTDVDGRLLAVMAGAGRVTLHDAGDAAAADRSLAHALFALRRESTMRGPQRLDLDGIGARLEADLLGSTVHLLDQHPPEAGVVLVPPGRLHAVPWSLLPSLRDRPVSVVPSAAAWLRACRDQPADELAADPIAGRVVLVGGPDLSAGATEIEELAKQYPSAEVLSDGSATAERVLTAMDGATLVHIAAHGTFRADSPLFSALELDDGPLTVYDLERLRRAPHRIVMSSCNSAVGAPSGADELLGLVSALIAQGCAGVVASVVPVNDPATVPLMLALHRGLAAGQSPAHALVGARAATRVRSAVSRATAESFVAMGA